MAESRKILIVDDDPVMRRLLQLMLLKIGFEADSVENGREAVKYICQRKYRLVFMDVNMPEVDGCQATTMIRTYEYRRGINPVPIVAVTGEGDREQCIASGMNDFMNKPVCLEGLGCMLQKWLPEAVTKVAMKKCKT